MSLEVVVVETLQILQENPFDLLELGGPVLKWVFSIPDFIQYFFCRFDSWDVLYPFEVFKYSLNFFLSFRSFLVPDTFSICLLTSFIRCFSALGVLHLSSITLLISTSSFEISSLDSSVFAAAASFVSSCLTSIMISSS